MAFCLVVPGVPVPKGRPRFTIIKSKFGKDFVNAYTPKETRVYEEYVTKVAKERMANRKPIENLPLKVEVKAYLPIPNSYSKKQVSNALSGFLRPAKKPDIDNLVKAALDACNDIIWKDDALICELNILKEYALNPRLEIIVSIIRPKLMGQLSL